MKISNKHHDHHLIKPSPWPIAISFSILILLIGFIAFIKEWSINNWIFGTMTVYTGVVLLSFILYFWWRDVIREAIHDHAHTDVVKKGLRIGMALFILSEIMFFAVFFSSIFKSWFFPVHLFEDFSPIVQATWPPKGLKTVDPWSVPLLNTVILLLSGCTVTWAHHALINGDNKTTIKMLAMTVILGISFSIIQALEYMHIGFSFKEVGDNIIYSSNFYMATGFHGAHVIIGTIFLLICFFRARKKQFSKEDHLGFEFAAWYWHFVDVVWLFLFVFLYCLSS